MKQIRKVCICALVFFGGCGIRGEEVNTKEEKMQEKEMTGNNIKEETDFQRALMIDGSLYFDTGYVSGITGRCGVMDGLIQSIIEEDQIPACDHEANFDAEGWQYGMEKDTIEVPFNGEWRIFAKEGTPAAEKEAVPAGVLQFMAVIEEVYDDHLIIRVDSAIPEMFSGKIKKDEEYQISLKAYDPGIYTDMPQKGNVVIVVCKNNVEAADPQTITHVYSISPVGSDYNRELNCTENR